MPISVGGAGLSKLLCPLALISIVAMPIAWSQADTFTLKSGQTIDGTVVEGTGMALFIKTTSNALRPVMIEEIEEIRLNLNNGDEVVGRVTGYQDGAYQMVIDDWLLHIKEGRVVKSKSPTPAGDAPSISEGIGGPAEKLAPDRSEEPTPDNSLVRRAPL